MRDQLHRYLMNRVEQCVSKKRVGSSICSKIAKKKKSLANRSAEIVKAKATGQMINNEKVVKADNNNVLYRVHFQYLIKQKDLIYMEEEIESRRASFYQGTLIEDIEIPKADLSTEVPLIRQLENQGNRIAYQYDRLKAVQYAERWWNDYNPAYRKFDVDCTNYVSQCMHAGGAPMWGQPNRNKGWWMTNNNWSYSWSVAHSLRWYLASSKTGLRAREVHEPEQLLLGDIICYDFQGDGRYDHNTIVTAKDANGMPLVNAHTYNSRMRYWAYEDSTAYTPNIRYKFFTIVDDS